MPLLELRDLTFTAGTRKILDGFDLTVEAGEIHALLGTNGTGKSTVAYLIMGCEGYKPDSGEILFDGRMISDFTISERAKLGITMAWQEPARFEGITVGNYLSLGRKDADPDEALGIVGLHPALYLNRMVDKCLSGGERKRIELASIFALQPRLAILDEPDSGIDMLSTGDILHVLRAFREKGSSVLLITHREEIVRISDRASQICGGKIVCTGNPLKVAEFYKSRQCLICTGQECVYV
ncbi:MAG TPA: ABC transporter ATP-binding protein [Dissulfurispiraceae bacterium]|nr:ABC transporter ATP-binding protein [Dissulfurispiraceae bacterium]